MSEKYPARTGIVVRRLLSMPPSNSHVATATHKANGPMSKKPLRLDSRDGFTVLELGSMEIWDGADMALLRESLTRLIKGEKHGAIAIDMRYVKYIPSGFFGLLFDWFETGVRIRLYSPQPNVRKMLWFDQFFEADGQDGFNLAPPQAPEFEPQYMMDDLAAANRARRDCKRVAAGAGR
jgi:hypothetical protein